MLITRRLYVWFSANRYGRHCNFLLKNQIASLITVQVTVQKLLNNATTFGFSIFMAKYLNLYWKCLLLSCLIVKINFIFYNKFKQIKHFFMSKYIKYSLLIKNVILNKIFVSSTWLIVIIKNYVIHQRWANIWNMCHKCYMTEYFRYGIDWISKMK